MTKKQTAALQRIIDRETCRYACKKETERKTAGVHPGGNGWNVVTDGYVAVLFPDGLSHDLPWSEDSLSGIYDMVRKETRYDHFLAHTVTVEDIREWKKLSKPWKAGLTHKTGAVPVHLTAHKLDGGTLDGYYDPRYLVDAVEAIGPGAMIYISKYSGYSSFCSLLIYPKDWMEDSEHTVGYVMPLRIGG